MLLARDRFYPAVAALFVFTPFNDAHAQAEPETAIEEVVVTGSRLRRDPLTERAPITALGRDQLERTGLTNLGDALQNLPITGSAPNSQFNVPGNSGFPQDGAGIGAGSVQVSLRNVEAKRTLVLVDGRRWVAGASASGVPGHVDLNTIPDNVIERVEILQDGASANGGRDAPQPQAIVANCASVGVPTSLVQTNPQLSAVSAGNASLSPETSDYFTVGLVWSTQPAADWIERFTASVDYYDLRIDDAIQGRSPGDVITACVATLDPLYCDLAPRLDNGVLDVVDNRLQYIGGIEASGLDVALAYTGPERGFGRLDASLNATFLQTYSERTANIDGTETVTDRAGTHTDETFQRAFPKLRWVTTLDWIRDRWAAALNLRWTDGMTLDGGAQLESALFTDLRLSYVPPVAGHGWTISLGFNNLFNEDPPVCFPCGVNGMSLVVHDLPGRVGYLRVTYNGVVDPR